MTAQIYPSAFAQLQEGTLDWLSNDIRVVLLGPAFEPDFTQQYVDSLDSTYVIATSDPVENRSYEDGVAFSYPAQFLQLLDNQAITHAVLYQDVGDPAYSPLIAYYTDINFLGTPLVPLGLDQFVYPDAILGWFTFGGSELGGEINTFEFAGDESLPLADIEGGDEAPAATVVLGGRLVVTTQVICATPDEPDNCSPPRIRSSLCE